MATNNWRSKKTNSLSSLASALSATKSSGTSSTSSSGSSSGSSSSSSKSSGSSSSSGSSLGGYWYNNTPSLDTLAQSLSQNSSSGSSGGNSQYTPKGTFNDAIISDLDKNYILACQEGYTSAMASGNIDLANQFHNMAQERRATYDYSGGDDGSEYIPIQKETKNNSFSYGVAQPSYVNKYDPEIDRLLNEILNRDDFSYDAMNDPLYQQYAQMYQREGDRAMRETLAEAAASAGGMNSYAITAAQQANNYYNSQLGDKIPELYQLAYNMYLNDKESKVQDLGILQNMDSTQYNRYRDTMNDWYNDRNFAYGIYRDDIADSQWNKTFNNNSYWAEKEFDNNNYWADKEFNNNNYWKEKDYTDQEIADAKAECEYWMERGIMPDDELIAKAGLNKANIEKYVAQIVAEQGSKGTSGGGSYYTGGTPQYSPIEDGGPIDPNSDIDISSIPESALAKIMTRAEWSVRSEREGNEASKYKTYEEYCEAKLKELAKEYN